MTFPYEYIPTQEEVRKYIQACEGHHTQQAIYSTFHDALTQVCYGLPETPAVHAAFLEAKAAVNTLITQARIEELERISILYFGDHPPETYVYGQGDNEPAISLTDRINKLTAELGGRDE